MGNNGHWHSLSHKGLSKVYFISYFDLVGYNNRVLGRGRGTYQWCSAEHPYCEVSAQIKGLPVLGC